MTRINVIRPLHSAADRGNFTKNIEIFCKMPEFPVNSKVCHLISLGHVAVGVRVRVSDRRLPHHPGDCLPISDIET